MTGSSSVLGTLSHERAGMRGIRRLMLTRFRSYRSATLTLDSEDAARPVVLTGANGAGKTNVLEALSLLGAGRGLRRARLRDIQQIGTTTPWAVAARVQVGDGEHDLGTGIDTAPNREAPNGEAPNGGAANREARNTEVRNTGAPDRRLSRIDGAGASGPGAFADYVSFLWLTPQMDRLFTDGASGRRRFFDGLVRALYPDHARQVTAFEQATRERNRLMEHAGRGADDAWIAALERRMAESAVAIAAARRDLVAALGGEIAARAEGAFPKALLALDGTIERGLGQLTALEAEEAYRARLLALRPVDAAAGRATEGPHRTDLNVSHAAKDLPADLCSTGEQKALLIGIVLAQAQMIARLTGVAPLLLLDEIAAHLDDRRRSALFEELLTFRSQAWLTGTDRMLFAALEGRAHFCDVTEGAIARAADADIIRLER